MEESEQNEVDRMKKGGDSTGKVIIARDEDIEFDA